MDHGLRDVLMPLVILGTIGTTLVVFTKAISDYILKKKMFSAEKNLFLVRLRRATKK